MKLFNAALLLAFSVTTSSATHAADELNLNLQTSSNIMTLQGLRKSDGKCYRKCDRMHKSDRWVRRCKRNCDAQDVDPNAQCNSLGEPCYRDSDCQRGGFDPCMKCGDERGTEYFHRCYGGIKRETPAPVPPPPPQCSTYDEPCEHDSDCAQGGFNPCTKCGKSRGTRYYKRCYNESEQEGSLEFIQSDELVADSRLPISSVGMWDDAFSTEKAADSDSSDEATEESDEGGSNEPVSSEEILDGVVTDSPTWDDIKNGTKRTAEDAADWGEKAADKTAEGAKDAANKMDEWGKETFDKNSVDTHSSSLAALSVTVLAGMQLTSGFDLW